MKQEVFKQYNSTKILNNNFELLKKVKKNHYIKIIKTHFPKNKDIINKFIEIAISLDKNHWIDFFNIINQSNKFKRHEVKELLFTLSEKTNDKKLKKIIYQYIKI